MPPVPRSLQAVPNRAARASAGVAGALTTAETAFGLLTCGPDPLALECTGLGPGVPPGVVPLDELRDLLTWAPFAVQQRIWPELVIAAQDGGPAWFVGVVGVALPGLRRIASRVAARHPGEREELDSEVLTGFWAAVKAIDPHAGRLPARLYWAAERAARRSRGAAAAHTERVIPELAVSTAPPPPVGHPDLVLAAAVRDGVLSGLQAELIGRTRLEKRQLRRVAEDFGLSFEQVRHLRRTGERNLVAALTAQHDGEQNSPSVSHFRPVLALQIGEGASRLGRGPRASRAACLTRPAAAGRRADSSPPGDPPRPVMPPHHRRPALPASAQEGDRS